MSRIGIVAAMERELRPLVRNWKQSGDARVAVFETERALAACAGMGAERVTEAAEALARLGVSMLVSVGWAGEGVWHIVVKKAK